MSQRGSFNFGNNIDNEYEMPPTLEQHRRMVANMGHPYTFPPNHYAAAGTQEDGSAKSGRNTLRCSAKEGDRTEKK